MDLPQLRAFTTVAEELHFGRAAARLGVSQPQVSRQVRALEDELGVELFTRTARLTALTEPGTILLADAREALAAAERLREHAGSVRRGHGGRVAVAFVWSTLARYLPELVAEAGARHPEIQLSVSQLTFLEVERTMRRGEVDMLIGRPLFHETEFVELTLRREPSVMALPEGHPLALGPTIPYDDIAGQPVIALNRSIVPRAYDAVIAAARARGHEPNIVQHTRSPAEALALVSAGIGLYRLPSSAAAPYKGDSAQALESSAAVA